MSDQALLLAPIPNNESVFITKKFRGEQVQIYGSAGDFSLVTDILGRAGYLPVSALSEVAVPVGADDPFVDCGRAPYPNGAERCTVRGQEQFTSCLAACPPGSMEVSPCAGNCRQHLAECLTACTVSPLATIAVECPSAPAPMIQDFENAGGAAPADSTPVVPAIISSPEDNSAKKKGPRKGAKQRAKDKPAGAGPPSEAAPPTPSEAAPPSP